MYLGIMTFVRALIWHRNAVFVQEQELEYLCHFVAVLSSRNLQLRKWLVPTLQHTKILAALLTRTH